MKRHSEVATLVGHSAVVSSLATGPDDETVVSGSYDRTVRSRRRVGVWV